MTKDRFNLLWAAVKDAADVMSRIRDKNPYGEAYEPVDAKVLSDEVATVLFRRTNEFQLLELFVWRYRYWPVNGGPARGWGWDHFSVSESHALGLCKVGDALAETQRANGEEYFLQHLEMEVEKEELV